MRSLWMPGRACGSKVDPTLCLPLSGKTECQGCGLFQETQQSPNSTWVTLSNLKNARWLTQVQGFLNLLVSNGEESICRRASGNFHLFQTVDATADVTTSHQVERHRLIIFTKTSRNSEILGQFFFFVCLVIFFFIKWPTNYIRNVKELFIKKNRSGDHQKIFYYNLQWRCLATS